MWGGARRPPVVEAGQQYGRLTVIGYTFSRSNRRHYLCACVCGSQVVVSSKTLRNGHTTSCGCRQREEFGERSRARELTHGHAVGKRSRTYRSWEAMRRRCSASTASDYARYGAAGVSVCERWDSFEVFLADMGERPEGRTLDRIDPAGDYEPANCRWATPLEQRLNRRVAA